MAIQPTINPGAVPMGANIVADRSGATFRCWAPRAKQVAIRGNLTAGAPRMTDCCTRMGCTGLALSLGSKRGTSTSFSLRAQVQLATSAIPTRAS
jgi:1,4-alpha-glucan branching enzyme